MKTFVLATALISGSALAHQECNVQIDSEINLSQRQVTVHFDGKQSLRLDGEQAWLNGDLLSLTRQEQQWAQDYYQGIMTTAPKAANIALDAVGLAGEGLTLAFSELVGEDSDLVLDIQTEFSNFRDELNRQFYDENGDVRFNFNQDNDADFFSSEFENKMEQRIESLVERSLGSLLMALGSEMMFGDGMEAFEQKMETFGEQIEARMESQAAQIEARAESLCNDLLAIDMAETKLSQSVSALRELDAIRLDKHM